MAIAPGHVVAEKYKILEQIGRGGMGSVWLAEHLLLGSLVAIKVIDYQGGEDDSVQRRFLQEARAAAQLRGTNVVQIFDYGIDEGVPFIVMERLVGETLGSRLARDGVLDPAHAAAIFGQIGRAVQKAHDGGIIHRDLKPENVFLVTDEEDVTAKVLDFGIAKALRKRDRGQETTATGVLLGSPLYMSPEQAHGAKVLDHRSDLWSLAVMAFECLTGRVPFRGQGWGELVAQICRDTPPVPSSIRPVPEGFDAWFARAAQRDPELRFQSCRELVETLKAVLVPASGPIRFVSSEPPAPPSTDRTVGLPGDSTLDVREPRPSPAPAPNTNDSVVTTLRSTTGAVASSDRPPEQPKRRGLVLALGVGLVAVVVAVAWSRQPYQGATGTASATRAPEPHAEADLAHGVDGAAVALTVDPSGNAAAPLVASADRPSELPVPSASAAVLRPTVARPPGERLRPGAHPPSRPTGAAPAPTNLLESRE